MTKPVSDQELIALLAAATHGSRHPRTGAAALPLRDERPARGAPRRDGRRRGDEADPQGSLPRPPARRRPHDEACVPAPARARGGDLPPHPRPRGDRASLLRGGGRVGSDPATGCCSRRCREWSSGRSASSPCGRRWRAGWAASMPASRSGSTSCKRANPYLLEHSGPLVSVRGARGPGRARRIRTTGGHLPWRVRLIATSEVDRPSGGAPSDLRARRALSVERPRRA